MPTHDIDATIHRLRAAAERAGANLVELERDPNHQMLAAAGLTGETAARWQQARAASANLFEWYDRLTALLDRVAATRGTRARLSGAQETELVALLEGRSIEIPTGPVPLDDRGLLDGSTKVETCTPDELIERMAEAFAIVQSVGTTAGRAWDALVPRVTQARATLDILERRAFELGPEDTADIDKTKQRLVDVGELLVTDPLAVHPAMLDTADAEIARLDRELDAAARLRGGFNDRAAASWSLLARVRDAARARDEARRAAATKIAGVAGLDVAFGAGEDAALQHDLEAILTLAGEGRWRAANDRMTPWEARAAEALRRGEDALAQARAPIEERDQLRGLLDAYRAKSARLGRIEDPECAALYEQAHAALFTAPTDLEAAAELVRRFQQCISGIAPGRKVPM